VAGSERDGEGRIASLAGYVRGWTCIGSDIESLPGLPREKVAGSSATERMWWTYLVGQCLLV